MQEVFEEEEFFEKLKFSKQPLPLGEYEACSFSHCDFSNANLCGFRFIECEFTDCNFSSTNLADVSLQDVRFQDCKMLGVLFDKCNDFGFSVNFENCQLDHSGFYRMRLVDSMFLNCRLHSVDFTEADLSNASFEASDLSGSIFDNTVLENTDFRSARNYSLDPEKNRVKHAKFSVPGVLSLLEKYELKIETATV